MCVSVFHLVLLAVELLPTQLTDHHTRLLNGLAAMGPHVSDVILLIPQLCTVY